MSPSIQWLALSSAATFSASLAADAHTLDCRQTRISTSGFTTLAAAQSFFPETARYVIEGGRVHSDFYGEGHVTDNGDHAVFVFPVEMSDGAVTDFRLTWTRLNNRYAIDFAADTGFEEIRGASGQCALRE